MLRVERKGGRKKRKGRSRDIAEEAWTTPMKGLTLSRLPAECSARGAVVRDIKVERRKR